MANLFLSVLKETCPYCGKAKIFEPGKNLPFQLPNMYQHCPSCKKDLEPEPGYFFGAMYVSYALAVAEGIAGFLIMYLLLGMRTPWVIVLIISVVIVLFSNKNLRWSRIIWLAIFSGRDYR